MPNTREKLIDIVEAYADFLDWDTKEDMVDSIMEKCFATDNNVPSKWIPVTERLPEQYESVIVWTSDRELGEAQFDGERFEWCADEAFADVTHWMPLPEPPKGE